MFGVNLHVFARTGVVRTRQTNSRLGRSLNAHVRDQDQTIKVENLQQSSDQDQILDDQNFDPGRGHKYRVY